MRYLIKNLKHGGQAAFPDNTNKKDKKINLKEMQKQLDEMKDLGNTGWRATIKLPNGMLASIPLSSKNKKKRSK